jgi:iron complex transport system permease protein
MNAQKEAKEKQPILWKRHLLGTLLLLSGFAFLIVSLFWAISAGAAEIDVRSVWRAIWAYDPSRSADRILVSLRIPRELGAALVGAAFAVSGAIMQGMTRNPLADSGLLGLNAGAIFALAIFFAFIPSGSYLGMMVAAFIGTAIGGGLVFGFSSLKRNQSSPLKITLAGAAVTALLTALGQGIALYFQLSQDINFWAVGEVSGTTWQQLKIITPLILGCIVLAILLSRRLTILSLGEEMATGLGQRTFRIRVILWLLVLLLAGAAVSLVGAIAFIGLLVPHVVRLLIGPDYRWIIPCSAVIGSLLMVLADTVARVISAPYETPTGAIVALIGLPFFLYLVRKGGRTFV